MNRLRGPLYYGIERLGIAASIDSPDARGAAIPEGKSWGPFWLYVAVRLSGGGNRPPAALSAAGRLSLDAIRWRATRRAG